MLLQATLPAAHPRDNVRGPVNIRGMPFGTNIFTSAGNCLYRVDKFCSITTIVERELRGRPYAPSPAPDAAAVKSKRARVERIHARATF